MKWIHSIRFRLIAATGLLAVFLLCVSVLGTQQFSKIAATVEDVSAQTELLIRLGHTEDNLDGLVQLLAKGWGEAADVNVQTRVFAVLDDVRLHLRSALARGTGAEASAALTEVTRRMGEVETWLGAARGRSLDEIDYLQTEEALGDALGTLAKLKLATAHSVESGLVGVRKGVREPVRLFWIVAGLGLALAICVMIFVHVRIASPINRLVAGVRTLARGERVVVQAEGRDELAELASSFNKMSETITDRTNRLKLVLDSTGDALVPVGLDGFVSGECSKRTLDWFGAVPDGATVWEFLGARSPAFADKFRVAFDQLTSEVFPFECAADLMPKDLQIEGTIYGLSYRAVRQGQKLEGVLIVLSDVTAQREAEAQEAESKEVFSVVGLCFRDPDLYGGFVADTLGRLASMKSGGIERQKADLHTIKGNAGMIGFVRIAQACHLMEDEIIESGRPQPPARFDELARLFAESRSRVEALAGPAQDMVQVTPSEFAWLLDTLESRDPRAAARAASWKLTRVRRILEQLGGHSKRIGERLGKQVDVVVECPELRMDRTKFEGVWAAMVHAIRNAVDHGIETPQQREAAGKRRQGQVKLSGKTEAGALVVTVEDDGRGIDVERLRTKVVDLHGEAAKAWPLIDLVCAKGASTAAQVSDTSGRGEGVGALREMVLDHGGSMAIETTRNQGTRLRIELPLEHAKWWQLQAA